MKMKKLNKLLMFFDIMQIQNNVILMEELRKYWKISRI
jgi:hypothetical protein